MFGQVILGLANSGKSTYCKVVGEYLKKKGRNIQIINLDPGVGALPYDCAIDIQDLVCVQRIMEIENVGPNESIIFAMELVLKNIKWLDIKLATLSNDSYLIIDLPGQVELYSHYNFIQKILAHLTDKNGLDCRLTSVFLAESIYCQQPESYIQIVYSSLNVMLHLALPHVNVLSKSKMLSTSKLPFKVEEYLGVHHLEYLVHYIKARENSKKKRLYEKMIDTIVDLPWHGFSLFDCEDQGSIDDVISLIDMSNMYTVKQKFDEIIDSKHAEKEMEFDKAADELVEKLF